MNNSVSHNLKVVNAKKGKLFKKHSFFATIEIRMTYTSICANTQARVLWNNVKTHVSAMRSGCWMRSVACGRHGNWGPPGGRWWQFCRSPHCPRWWTRSSHPIRWASGPPPAAGTANHGPRTQSLWWCWEPQTAAAWAWCQRACMEQSGLKNTENMQVYSYANNTELLFPSLSFICMSYSTPPLARRKVILIIKLFHCSKCYKRSHNHSFLKLQTVNLVKYVL